MITKIYGWTYKEHLRVYLDESASCPGKMYIIGIPPARDIKDFFLKAGRHFSCRRIKRLAFFFYVGCMKVTATAETFANKESAIKGIRSATWVRGDANFETLIALYRAGHIINISDTISAGALILDLDHLSQKQAIYVDNQGNLGEIASRLKAEYAICLESSSRLPSKRKIFLKIKYARDIKDGVDLAATHFRKLFEKETGIVADAKMDRAAQLTFGCKETGAPTLDISRWQKTRQPRNIDFGEKMYEKPPKTFQFIPLNMGAYNHKYGKATREGGRLEWNIYRYTKNKSRVIAMIRHGKRHTTLPRLCAAIVWNAINLNMTRPDTRITLEDCDRTLRRVVEYQFEDGKEFWGEEGGKACSQLAAMWAEYAGMQADVAYAALIAKTGEKARFKYVPRDIEATKCFHYLREKLVKCTTYAEVKNICGKAADGDLDVMKRLLRYCRNDKDIPKGKKGKVANYRTYIETCPCQGGIYFVGESYYHRKAFRDFCREHNFKVKKRDSFRPLDIYPNPI